MSRNTTGENSTLDPTFVESLSNFQIMIRPTPRDNEDLTFLFLLLQIYQVIYRLELEKLIN